MGHGIKLNEWESKFGGYCPSKEFFVIDLVWNSHQHLSIKLKVNKFLGMAKKYHPTIGKMNTAFQNINLLPGTMCKT